MALKLNHIPTPGPARYRITLADGLADIVTDLGATGAGVGDSFTASLTVATKTIFDMEGLINANPTAPEGSQRAQEIAALEARIARYPVGSPLRVPLYRALSELRRGLLDLAYLDEGLQRAADIRHQGYCVGPDGQLRQGWTSPFNTVDA